jgi:nitrate reductase assembly molybdenum cofactor insertion protein NarJ
MVTIEERAREFALASTLSSYPDEEVEATIRDLAPMLEGHEAASPFLRALASPDGFDALRHDYVDLFDRGEGKMPLYETEYGRMRALAKGNALADISGFYRAFGLAPDEEVREMLDHIAVELEFYAMLLAKQAYLAGVGDAEGREIVEDARRKFLGAHLGPLSAAIAARLGDGRERPAYGEVLSWCAGIVGSECAALGVTLSELDYAEDEEDREEMKCGPVRLPVLQ